MVGTYYPPTKRRGTLAIQGGEEVRIGLRSHTTTGTSSTRVEISGGTSTSASPRRDTTQ